MALEENIITMNVTNSVSVIVMFLVDVAIILALFWLIKFLLAKLKNDNAATV